MKSAVQPALPVGERPGGRLRQMVGSGLALRRFGALIALVLCFLSLTLGQSQTAVGFVLALLCTELSSFLGAPYVRVPGPSVPFAPIPLLGDIPLRGPLLFRHDLVIYGSFLLVPLTWWLLFRSRAGLTIRALGERFHRQLDRERRGQRKECDCQHEAAKSTGPRRTAGGAICHPMATGHAKGRVPFAEDASRSGLLVGEHRHR